MNRIHMSWVAVAAVLFMAAGCTAELAGSNASGEQDDAGVSGGADAAGSAGHAGHAGEQADSGRDVAPGPDAAEPDSHVGNADSGEEATPGPDAGLGGVPPFYLPAECGPAGAKYDCDPLSSAGCSIDSGWVCDFAAGGFACYPPPNDGAEGQECNVNDGPLCGLGMTCSGSSAADPNGVCRRFCCSDDECLAGQSCVAFSADFGSLGSCQ